MDGIVRGLGSGEVPGRFGGSGAQGEGSTVERAHSAGGAAVGDRFDNGPRLAIVIGNRTEHAEDSGLFPGGIYYAQATRTFAFQWVGERDEHEGPFSKLHKDESLATAYARKGRSTIDPALAQIGADAHGHSIVDIVVASQSYEPPVIELRNPGVDACNERARAVLGKSRPGRACGRIGPAFSTVTTDVDG